jgi:hypothetical protein
MLAQANIGQPCPVCGKKIEEPNNPPARRVRPVPGCQRCGKKRVARVDIEAEDMASVEMGEFNLSDDYLPNDMGIGTIEFDFCLECGQIQGKWPRPKTMLEGAEDEDAGG